MLTSMRLWGAGKAQVPCHPVRTDSLCFSPCSCHLLAANQSRVQVRGAACMPGCLWHGKESDLPAPEGEVGAGMRAVSTSVSTGWCECELEYGVWYECELEYGSVVIVSSSTGLILSSSTGLL